MPKLTPQMFAFLQAPQAESVLLRLYTQALKQNRQMIMRAILIYLNMKLSRDVVRKLQSFIMMN